MVMPYTYLARVHRLVTELFRYQMPACVRGLPVPNLGHMVAAGSLHRPPAPYTGGSSSGWWLVVVVPALLAAAAWGWL